MRHADMRNVRRLPEATDHALEVAKVNYNVDHDQKGVADGRTLTHVSILHHQPQLSRSSFDSEIDLFYNPYNNLKYKYIHKLGDNDKCNYDFSNGSARSPASATAVAADRQDGGKRAWLFMISACLIEALLWGFTTSYGIFLSHYKDQPELLNSNLLSSVGTCASGIPFLGAPLVTLAVSRWPHLQRQMVWFGTALCIGSLVGAGSATKGWHLLLSQGVGYGLGVLIVYYPMLTMVNSWFTERRGFAYGVLFGAAGASGTALPFLVEFLLNKYGYSWTLRGYACAIALFVIPTFPFCHGRPSPNLRLKFPRRPNWAVLKDASLIIFSLANLFQGLAYYIPTLYLPSFARALNFKPAETVLALAILNASQVIAQVVLGFVSDKVSVFMLVPVSTIGAAVWTISLWYFGRTVGAILAFSSLFGLFTGGFTSLWARFNMTLSDDKATQEFAYGVLAMQRGLGNVMAGPISMALLQMHSNKNVPDREGAFNIMILFVTASMALASIGGLGGLSRRNRKPAISVPMQDRRVLVWEARHSRT